MTIIEEFVSKKVQEEFKQKLEKKKEREFCSIIYRKLERTHI